MLVYPINLTVELGVQMHFKNGSKAAANIYRQARITKPDPYNHGQPLNHKFIIGYGVSSHKRLIYFSFWVPRIQ